MNIKIVKKVKKNPVKASALMIRVEEDFDKKWKAFAKENKINTSQTVRCYLEKIMKARS